MNRDEHLEWCKARALEYVDVGDLKHAIASMMSDLRKHPGTHESADSFLAYVGMLDASKGNIAGVRRWITGFN